jgi:hypothetical protein
MKIAYLILAHQYPEQLVRIVESRNTENTTFFIHINKKIENKIYNQFVKGLSHLPNVHFIKNRQVIYMFDFGHTQASLEGIKEVIESKVDFDYLILGTGQDYSIKSNRSIENFFQENEGKIFLDYMENLVLTDGLWPNRGADNINYWHVRLWKFRFVFPGPLNMSSHNRYCNSEKPWYKILSFLWDGVVPLFPIKRKFPEGFIPYRGSSYWCFPRDCVEYIYNFLNTPKGKGYVNYFKYVDGPDEMFFQTLLLSSPLKDRVVNDNLFFIDWENPNPTRPRVFEACDFERLVNSPKLFARKFNITRDSEILDLLDQRFLQKDELMQEH